MPGRQEPDRPPTKQNPVAAITITLTTGRYLISTDDAQWLIQALQAIKDVHPDAPQVATMLEQHRTDAVPHDIELRPNEREAILRTLEEGLGHGPLTAELYSLRDALLKET